MARIDNQVKSDMYKCRKSDFDGLCEYLCNLAYALEIKSTMQFFEVADEIIFRVQNTEYSPYSLEYFMQDNENFILCKDKHLLKKVKSMQYNTMILYQ